MSEQIEKIPNIKFFGPIYNKSILDELKRNCRYYIHGHSVGGTNPSLLESMITGCTVLAHDNPFNRDVLGNHGHYWENEHSLIDLLRSDILRNTTVQSQILYCRERFDWVVIAKKYLELFENINAKLQ